MPYIPKVTGFCPARVLPSYIIEDLEVKLKAKLFEIKQPLCTCFSGISHVKVVAWQFGSVQSGV